MVAAMAGCRGAAWRSEVRSRVTRFREMQNQFEFAAHDAPEMQIDVPGR